MLKYKLLHNNVYVYQNIGLVIWYIKMLFMIIIINVINCIGLDAANMLKFLLHQSFAKLIGYW